MDFFLSKKNAYHERSLDSEKLSNLILRPHFDILSVLRQFFDLLVN